MANRESDAITLRQWLPLIGLTASAFIFNTSEFMPVGLLTDIGGTFGLSDSEAGIMITVYAWGVMLLSLPLMMAASRLEFKKLLLLVIATFATGQFLSAIAPTYVFLIGARLIVACAHAVFWSIASIMASRLVSVKHGPLALSMIATGTSVALIFGLPIGRAIGLLVGWRMTFGIVGCIAVGVVIYQGILFPPMPAGEPFTLAKLPDLVKNRLLVGMYIVTVLFATAYYTGYSYIEPFLAKVGGIDPGTITVALTVFGVAGMLASIIFSRYYERRRCGFLTVTDFGVALALLLLQIVAGSLGAVVAVFIIWGLCGTLFNIAFQSELIRCTDRDESSVAMAIWSGLFNLGIGGGSALGGIAVSSLGIASVGYVGGAIGLLSFALCVLLVVKPLRARIARA